jgi:hypothetical protein
MLTFISTDLPDETGGFDFRIIPLNSISAGNNLDNPNNSAIYLKMTIRVLLRKYTQNLH